MLMPGALPRMGSWNSRPMTLARLCSAIMVTSAPSSMIRPVSTKKLPQMALNSVDLPAPFAPMMEMKSPFFTCSDTPSSATRASDVPG